MERSTFDDLYVRRLKEHDPSTEEHFARYFHGVLLSKLHGRLPPQEIDDFIQDVLMKVLARIGDLREGEKLGAWVLGFCKNDLRERYRQRPPAEPLDERHLEILGKVNIEEELLRKEAVAAVYQLLSEMSDTREAKIVRALLDGTDRDEVCRSFGLSDENFRVILHRATEKFRTLFRRKNKR